MELLSLTELLLRDAPDVLQVVEVLGVEHVVPQVLFSLDPEHVLGISGVGEQRLWHRVLVDEQVREYCPVGDDDGVRHIPHIEVHRAIESVDNNLDAVPDVVEALRRRVGIGIPVGHGIGVLYPVESPVGGHDVRVLIEP